MPSERRLVDIDANGVHEYAHFDPDGKLVGLEWAEDVEPVLEQNKRLQNDGTKGYGKTREWQHTASIPPIMFMKFAMQRCGNSPEALKLINSREGFEEIVMKMIKDPDYRYLRTDV